MGFTAEMPTTCRASAKNEHIVGLFFDMAVVAFIARDHDVHTPTDALSTSTEACTQRLASPVFPGRVHRSTGNSQKSAESWRTLKNNRTITYRYHNQLFRDPVSARPAAP